MTQDPMEYIWEKTAGPGPDGEKVIIYSSQRDLDYLYSAGFVDTEAFTLDEWRKAFADSRQKDGSFRLNHDQWLAKRPFRYNKRVTPPFNPHSLPDAGYTDEELTALLEKEVVPATPIRKQDIPKFLDALKQRTPLKDGRFVFGPKLKDELAWLLEHYPSPLRKLQIRVARVIQRQMKGEADYAAATATSLFSTEAGFDETAARQIADVEKVRRPEVKITPKEKATDLKSELSRRQKHKKV